MQRYESAEVLANRRKSAGTARRRKTATVGVGFFTDGDPGLYVHTCDGAVSEEAMERIAEVVRQAIASCVVELK